MAFITINHHSPVDNGAAFVAENATLAGSVRLEKNSSVWYGAVLRADTGCIAIGENSNVQDDAVLHTGPGLDVTVGRGTSVGHGAVVHGCTVGDGCLIGMHATILNGAVIGDGCLIAGGACAGEHAGARGEPCHRRARQGRAARQRGTGCRHQGQRRRISGIGKGARRGKITAVCAFAGDVGRPALWPPRGLAVIACSPDGCRGRRPRRPAGGARVPGGMSE